MYATDIPFRQYVDQNGDPLNSGYIYFGQPNQNPETAPVTVYWDAAGTQPALQPIRTTNGLAIHNGAIANLFAAVNYSMTVRDRNGGLVFYAPTADRVSLAAALADDTDVANGATLIGYLGETLREFLDRLATSAGAAQIGFSQPGGAARTVQQQLDMLYYGVANVRDTQYAGGAVGDGVADDTAAIQAAITAVSAAGGGNVFVARGTYKVTAALNLASNVRLTGQGADSIIALAVADWGLKIPAAATNIEIAYLKVNGVSSRAIGTVNGSGASNIRIHDCDISGATLEAAGYTSGIFLDGVSDSWVERNTLHGNGLGAVTASSSDIMFYITQNSRNHVLANNCKSTAVSFNIMAFQSDNTDISGNVCTGAVCDNTNIRFGYGITLYDNAGGLTNYNSITNNKVYSTGGTGIYLASASNNTIAGNVCNNNSLTQLDATLPSAGIALNGPSCVQNVVSGNMIASSGKDGISLSVSSFNTVTGNTINSCIQYGIRLRGVVTNVGVSDNIVSTCSVGILSDATLKTRIAITGNTVTTNTGIGINIANMDSSVINGNNVFDNGTHGLTVAGDSNTINSNTVIDNSGSAANTYDGISLSSTKSTVNGNVSGNQAPNGQRYGINSNGADCSIHNNNLLNNRTDGAVITGTSTVKRGNKYSANNSQGTAVLVAGTTTVASIEARTGDVIMLTRSTAGGALGHLNVSSIVNATSFTITSSSATDTSTVQWEILH